MPRPPRGRIAERILDAAAEIFAEQGFHAASMRTLARRLQCTPAALYYHAENKEDLLFKIARTAFENLLEPLTTPAFQTLPPTEQLRFLIHHHLQLFARNLNLMKVLAHEAHHLHGPRRQTIQSMKRSYVQLTTEILRKLTAGLDPPVTAESLRWSALSLFGMMNWIYTWFRRRDIERIEEYADHVYFLFLDGLYRLAGDLERFPRPPFISIPVSRES